MEDIKWFIKKFGIIFVILLVMIVSVGIFSNRSIKNDSKLVPIIDLITNFLPILKNANIKKGIFSANITVPIEK